MFFLIFFIQLVLWICILQIFISSHKFIYVVHFFSFNYRKCLISFLLYVLTHFLLLLFSRELFNFLKFVAFCCIHMYTSLYTYVEMYIRGYLFMVRQNVGYYFSVILFYFFEFLILVLSLSMWSSLEIVPWGAEKKVYFFLCLDELFYEYLLDLFGL